MQLSRDQVSELAVKLQNMVIWRGCGVGGTFDEHYDTSKYRLFSDEWEMFHIRVTRKSDQQVILSATDRNGSEHWSGTEADYNQLWREVAIHNQTIEAMRREDIIEAPTAPPVLLTVKGDTPPAKVIWSKGDIQLLWLSIGVVLAFIATIIHLVVAK